MPKKNTGITFEIILIFKGFCNSTKIKVSKASKNGDIITFFIAEYSKKFKKTQAKDI